MFDVLGYTDCRTNQSLNGSSSAQPRRVLETWNRRSFGPRCTAGRAA